MTNKRRMTINPPLTEAEFARFCVENPCLEIDRDPNGVIVMSRTRKCRDGDGAWLLSQQETVSSDTDLNDDGPSIRVEFDRIAQAREDLEALRALQDGLILLRETFEEAHAATLNAAIRALASDIDILNSVIAHEQRMPQKMTGRDMDTNDQRKESSTDVDQSVEKALEMQGGDPAKRYLAERIVSTGRILRTVIANFRAQSFELSDRDIRMSQEMIKDSPAPKEKLMEVIRRNQRGKYLSETTGDDNEGADPLTAPFLALLARDIADFPETITAVEPELIERVNRLVDGLVVDPDESLGDGAWTKDEQS